MAIIIGIDPGSRVTGYGIIHSEGNQHRYIDAGSVEISATRLDQKLHAIFQQLTEIIGVTQPTEGAIEQVFMHENANTAIKLGQARGSAIVAMANFHIPVAEYSAREIKQAVVGYGAATKQQVQHMVRTILNLDHTPASDAADALAVAICHAQRPKGIISLVRRNQSRRGRRSRWLVA